ncbi:DUF983 domain-containing protein [Oleiharenicola lentus]|uniref:DUF983 domain-containing protein n=1 Tax=Oleiharenicola lentus TaxID=2508720 RepID=UPI003F67B6A2
MKVTHGQIIARGLTNCCPNCGAKTLFKEGTWFELADQCSACGLRIEKDEGFFLGAMAINYGVTVIGFLSPVAILWYYGVLGPKLAIGLALGAAVFLPLLLYRSTRSWQLMLYYSFLPQHLPANRRELSALEDENV